MDSYGSVLDVQLNVYVLDVCIKIYQPNCIKPFFYH